VIAAASPSLQSTGDWLLTPRGILIANAVNGFGAKTTAKDGAIPSIWYCIAPTVPYVAENELEHDASRRFGRDSFQTRSTP
jgi:hypothetical protein